MKYFMGIDIGGTHIKAVLFDESGTEMCVAKAKTPLLMPQEGYYERDMDELWLLTSRMSKECIAISGIDPHDILAVGCTGHGKGVYLWGKDGRPAYHAIASTDHRAQDIVCRWHADGTNEKAKRKTLQDVIECQPAALLRWFAENRPEVLEQTRWIFEAKDYIRFLLTAEAYAEITDYSGSALMDLEAGRFDMDLLKLYGIAPVFEKLPPLRYSCDVCGYVTLQASRKTGIPEGTLVCGGMFDIDACALALGAHQSEDICVVTGTWSINEYISRKPHKAARNSLFCIPGYYLIEESSPTSAGNLEWVIRNMMEKEAEDCARRKISIYDRVNEMVEAVAPENSSAVFLPFLYGTNIAGLDSACLYGLTNKQDKRDVLRAVYEGVAFGHLDHIRRLLAGRKGPAAIRLAGGVAQSAVWSQMFADITGIPVKTVDAHEPGGLGCAIVCAAACGKYRDIHEAAERMVTVSHCYEPNLQRTKIYQKKYRKYREITRKLSSKCE